MQSGERSEPLRELLQGCLATWGQNCGTYPEALENASVRFVTGGQLLRLAAATRADRARPLLIAGLFTGLHRTQQWRH